MTEEEVLDTGTAPEVSEPVPAPEPATDPEPSQPVEVVSVDELVDRLIQEAETGTEETAPEEDPAAAEEELPSEPVDIGPMEIAGMDQVLRHLETLETTMVHPALDTPFEEYTVTEGLLLLLLVLIVVSWCVKMIKGGFSWLLW